MYWTNQQKSEDSFCIDDFALFRRPMKHGRWCGTKVMLKLSEVKITRFVGLFFGMKYYPVIGIVRITISYYEHPYKQTRIQWNVTRAFDH